MVDQTPDEQALYSKLQANSGINFNDLKQKYRESAAGAKRHTESTSSSNDTYQKTADENKLSFDQLRKYKICVKCGGQGFIKTLYNHIVKQVNCDACYGDAILLDQELLRSQLLNLKPGEI